MLSDYIHRLRKRERESERKEKEQWKAQQIDNHSALSHAL